MSRGIFITGTGTDVGKTYITALLVRALREKGIKAGYYKAALSGAQPVGGRLLPGDACYVRETAGMEEEAETMVSYIYEHAVSPHLAARLEGNPPVMEKIKEDYRSMSRKYPFLVVEGSGGIVCPIRWDEKATILLEDIIKEMGLGALIVSDSGLGSINAAVLTVEYMKNREIPVHGIIMNRFHAGDVMEEDNRRMISEISGIPVIAAVAEGSRTLDMDVNQLLTKCS